MTRGVGLLAGRSVELGMLAWLREVPGVLLLQILQTLGLIHLPRPALPAPSPF